MKILENIKLVIFDLDGVVVHTKPDLAIAVQKTLEAVGCKPLSQEEAGNHVGGGAKKAFTALLGPEHAQQVDEAVDFFRVYYGEHCIEFSSLYPGIKEVLEHFYGRVKIAMATAKIRSATIKILKKLNVFQYFDLLVTADDMQRMKPDPQCIEIILQSLGIEPSEAVMIGDMATDIQAGKAAGTATIGVTYGYGKPKDLVAAGPDIILGDAMGLVDIIK